MAMAKWEEYYIAGQCIARIGKAVRAPLHLLMINEGIVEVEAHQTNEGAIWFERKFKTQTEAAAYLELIKAVVPGGKSTKAQLQAAMGGRKGFGASKR